MGEPVLERLRQGPLLCDGAMGTVLYARASERMTHGRCFDELVLSDPSLVQAIHREYIFAGAQIVETNTFGANALKLDAYGLADHVAEINRKAAALAREAREVAGQAVFIAGAVGPAGQAPSPAADDVAQLATLRAAFAEQITALVEGGVDLIILETFSSLVELRQAVLAAREVCALPLVAQMTFTEEGQTLSGESPTSVALALSALGVDVIGSNCSVGPAGIEDTIHEMAAALQTVIPAGDQVPLLSAQPNAGLPARVENRFLYVSTPTYFADYARRFAEAGVRLIGGCCGTTPSHIGAMRTALADYLPSTASSFTVTLPPRRAALETVADAEQPAASGSRLRRTLEAGRFVVSAELDPPKGLNPQKILDGAAHLKSQGVEFINIADSPMARVRMSCLALARLLLERLDLEPIIHFTTRDRNLMAIQADLLGAHALGIQNILALTGDPMHAGTYPMTGVWDVDSVGLLRVLQGLNEGHDAAGASLGQSSGFFLGAALNLNMEDTYIDLERERKRNKLYDTLPDGKARLTETELELRRLRLKLDAGAQYIMTQPIYNLAPLEAFYEAFGPVEVPMILGMIPLHSSKHAEYLHNEVPGITIPAEVRARMREAGERGRDVGIELAREVITTARDRGLIQGCYLMPSYGRYDLIGELASELLRTSSPQEAEAR
jgi:methionine synthase I (cobalamin-dependent)/5,10-methylenetetrahydrofolate reductase